MKRFILTACAGLLAVAAASPSFAADLPRKAPIYVAPAFSWTGFYVGINGGYGWGHTDWSNTAMPSFAYNIKGGLLGGTVGYNLQTGSWVFGAEGDFDATWIDGLNTGGGVGTVCDGPSGCETKLNWLATARGRVGYAWDRFLPYITGGAAIGAVRMTPNGGASETDTRIGWTVGAGVEYAFLGAWSAKVEYLYTDLGTASCSAATCGLDTDVHPKLNIVRLGVNYRF